MSSVPYQYSGVETLIMAAQLDSLRANAAMSNNIQLPSSIPFQSMPLFSQRQQQYAPAGHNAYQHQHQHQHPHQHQHQQPQPSSAPSQPPPMVQPQQSTPKELMLQAPFKIPISLQAREPNQVPTPRNKSELELYHVLKQANLLDYYQTFIKLGGDDLEQLAEAEKNEEEFLEIVQLVGMSSKPLHVRRFQKAVRRWREDKSEPLDVTSRPQADIYYDTGCNVSQDFSFRSDLTHCSSVLDESVAPSTASRSLFPPEDHDYQSRYCTPPHQIIKNAPKRPRLMDSIMPNDLTKGIQIEDSATKEETPRRQRFSNLRISPIRAEALSSVLPSDERRQRGNRLSPPDSPVSQASYPNSETSHSPLEALDEEPQEEKKKKPITMNKRKRLLKKPSPTNLEEFYNTKNPVHQIAKPSKASDLTE